MKTAYVRIGRKSIPHYVETTIQQKVKNMSMRCPVCNNPLWGKCEIGHVIPVALGGDNLPVRTFVGLHQSCNRRIGRTVIDLTNVNLKKIILVKYG